MPSKQRNKSRKKNRSRRASEVDREAEVQEVAAAVGQHAGLLLAGERGEVGAEHALAALQLGLPHGRREREGGRRDPMRVTGVGE